MTKLHPLFDTQVNFQGIIIKMIVDKHMLFPKLCFLLLLLTRLKL